MSNGIDLGKQMGPLPLGGWIAAGGGVMAMVWFMNRNRGPEPGLLTERGVGEGGGQFIYDEPQRGSGELDVEETNEIWGRRATNWLVAQGHDPGIADQAVRKYLQSDPLTVREQGLINLVLLKFGTPPEALTPTEGGGGGDTQPPPPDNMDKPHMHNLQVTPSIVPYGGSFELSGRISYGGSATKQGEPPGQSEAVMITVFSSVIPGTPASRYFVLTNPDGTWRTRPGWTRPAVGRKRTYKATWRGVTKARTVNFN